MDHGLVISKITAIGIKIVKNLLEMFNRNTGKLF